MAAERVEGRVLAERNTSETSRDRTQRQAVAMSGLTRVHEVALKDRKQQFTALLHHLSPELLELSFSELNRQVARGLDGVSWQDYNENLVDNIMDLHTRVLGGSYRPKPSRRVEIPKGDGTSRTISIQCVEDKIVQQAITKILSQIYEVDFMGFSYGFRAKRNQHDALDALNWGITRRKVNWVLDMDIQKFFDTVEHEWLIRMLQHRVQDKRLLKLIIRWIKVGVVDENGKRLPVLIGVPQGAVISPLLSNIYLHYAFDLWSDKWRTQRTRRDVVIVRYADDAVLGFQSKREADCFLSHLRRRLDKFGLSLHSGKTRLIRFGRFAAARHKEYKEGKPGTFDFLGFTHYCSAKRDGRFRVGRKTSRKRLFGLIKAVQRDLVRRLHHPLRETLQWLSGVFRGHMNYFSVPGNIRCISFLRTELTTHGGSSCFGGEVSVPMSSGASLALG